MSHGLVMTDPYTVRPLGTEQIAQALPLVRVLDPQLTLDRWSSYAMPFIEPTPRTDRREIITVQSDQGCIHGLAACRLKPELHGGPVLEVENFVCLDPAGGGRAASTLLRAMESYARNWNCGYLRLSLLEPRLDDGRQDRNRFVLDLLQAAGYRPESARFGKNFVALGR